MYLIFYTLALSFWVLLGSFQVTPFPVEVQDNNLNQLRQIILQLENYDRPIPRDDDDDTPKRDLIFPGVLNVIFGVVTGDLRRVLEDGAFSFVNKNVRDQVFLVYNNIIGKTTTKATTEPAKSTRRRRITTDSDFDVDETDAPEGQVTTRKSINYQKPQKYSIRPKSVSTSATKKPERDEDEELARR